MIKRINPLYLLMLFSTIMIIVLFNVNIKNKELARSNEQVSDFHKQLNEYISFNKNKLSKNMVVEEIKKILEDELPKDLNVGVKTLKQYIEIEIKYKKTALKMVILEVFYKSKLKIEQLQMDKEHIFIKVKI